MATSPRRRPPVWFTILILVMLIPVVAWPFMLIGYDAEKADNWWIVNLFPIYSLLACWVSYKCYIDRREISYIILGVLLLSYMALPFLF